MVDLCVRIEKSGSMKDGVRHGVRVAPFGQKRKKEGGRTENEWANQREKLGEMSLRDGEKDERVRREALHKRGEWVVVTSLGVGAK